MNSAPPPSSSALIIHSSVDPHRPDMCFCFDKCAMKTRRLAEKYFFRQLKTLGARSAVMCALWSEKGKRGRNSGDSGEWRSDAHQTGSGPPRFKTLSLGPPRGRLSGALVSSGWRTVVFLWWKNDKSSRERGSGEQMDGKTQSDTQRTCLVSTFIARTHKQKKANDS